MTFNQIADHLNKKKILSVRGKKFRGAHVHSIIKRKRVRDEKLEREYPEVRLDFYLDIYDKSILFIENNTVFIIIKRNYSFILFNIKIKQKILLLNENKNLI